MYPNYLPNLTESETESILHEYKQELSMFRYTHALTREEKTNYPFHTYTALFEFINPVLAARKGLAQALKTANKARAGKTDDWLVVKKAYLACLNLLQVHAQDELILKYRLKDFISEYEASRRAKKHD